MNEIGYILKNFNRYKKYFKRVNVDCCNHIDGNSRLGYHIGWVKHRWCKIAICIDCGTVQYVGNRFLFQILARRIKKMPSLRITLDGTMHFKMKSEV